MTRRGWEFDERTKESARLKWHKENPNKEDEILEVDHKVAVHFAKRKGLPKHLVRSQKNAVALTRKDHKEKHRNEPTDEEYATIAQALFGIVKKLF